MRYEVVRYDVSADDKMVVIDAGDIVAGLKDDGTVFIVLKPLRKR